MRIVKRLDQRDIVQPLQRGVHHLADIGVEMDGEDHRHILARGELADGRGDPLHPAAEILAPVAGDADDTLACEARLEIGKAARQRGFALDLRRHPVQRVDHRVAGDVDRGCVDILRPQCRRRGLGRRAMERGDAADDLAVHFLGPGMVDIAAAKPGLDMAHADLAVIGRHRACHRCRRVALHHHPVGLLLVNHRADPGEQPPGQRVERLIRLHDVEIVVGHEPGNLQHLVEHPAMLPGHADAAVEARVVGQRVAQREELDRFGARAEDGEDAYGLAHAEAPSAKALNRGCARLTAGSGWAVVRHRRHRLRTAVPARSAPCIHVRSVRPDPALQPCAHRFRRDALPALPRSTG